jgi:RNA polymerase sigma-70 factor, ECF subfamily
LEENDDLKLIDRIQGGDQDAFKELVERYQRKVYSICYGMLKEREACLDVSQEVFIKVYRYLEKFNRESSFYTWLYRITVNMCIDYIRKNSKVQRVEYDDQLAHDGSEIEGEEHILPSTLGIHPDKVYGRKELRKKMAEALETLSEKHRTILVLREVEGLSYEEMADVLNVSKGTVMSRLYHARRYFQDAIKEYLKEDLKVI